MAKMNDLGLRDDATDIGDPDQVPEQMQPPAPTPQPGRYEFRLPENLAEAWARVDALIGDRPVERVQIQFDSEHPLVISWDPRSSDLVGQRMDNRISNVERKRGKDGPLVSDMFYLLRDGLGAQLRPTMKNSEWIAALNQYAGRFFGGDVELQASCNPKAPIRGTDNQPVEGTHGCGQRYYNADIPRIDGIYQVRFTCGGQIEERDFQAGGVLVKRQCGSILRAFPQIARFRRAEQSSQRPAVVAQAQ